VTRVLVVGDLMIDEYVDGTVDRISTEAPVPIFVEKKVRRSPGGAGNVNAGVIAAGASSTVIGVVGDDEDGHDLSEMCVGCVVMDSDRSTTRKTRFAVDGHQLLRVDSEDTTEISPQTQEVMTSAIAGYGSELIVLSDYAKGVLTHAVCTAAILSGRRVIVDPKRDDWSRYAGAWLITPNAREMASAMRYAGCDSVARMMLHYSVANCLVTLGAGGVRLHQCAMPEIITFPAVSSEVVDVTGAGDTVVAWIAAVVANGDGLVDAVRIANSAAGAAVRRRGTHVVTREELGL
jgi:D-beta-D-heptose 7-phosphate kinase/D-beta-D-heptose 1-phosphate adenosyltransferase